MKSMLDPRAVMLPGNIGKANTGIFIDLAKDVLYIDLLKRSSSDIGEIEASIPEFDFLPVHHDPDDIGFSIVAKC